MKIFSDMDRYDLLAGKQDSATEAPSVQLESPDSILGRKRTWTHDVMLTGVGARHTRRKNPGNGANRDYDTFAATWMDWGWFIACLFRHEPTAVIGQYQDREHFLETTAWHAQVRLHHTHQPDRSIQNFARDNAAIWKEGTSPFVLVDRLCPPSHLINLADRPVVEAYLAS